METSITRKTVVLVGILITLVGGGNYLYQRKLSTSQKLGSQPVIQTPPATSPEELSKPESPPEETDPTAGWIEYKNILEGVTFKLPPETRKPLWDNVGQSTKGTYLPGNTRLTMSNRGEGEYLFADYTKFTDALKSDALDTKETIVSGRSAIEFTGKITAGNYSYVGANCNGKIKGIVQRLGPTKYFVISHTACDDFKKLYPEKEAPSFEADEQVFKLILSTLRFGE